MKQRFLFPILAAVLGFCTPAAAQTTATAQTPARITQPETQVIINPPNAEDTRQDLRQVLELYPYSVGEILRRDPTLMGRADYLASYPRLAEFIAQHPEVQRNAEYYFDGFDSWQRSRRLDPSFEAVGILLGGIAAGFVLIMLGAIIIWLVRAFIQHRRWLRASQVQADVHTKLMERMTNNDELLAYVQSPAGRRFLEAAPLRPEADGPSFSAPVGSIVWSLMAGVVLTVLGVGFRYAGTFVKDDAHDAIVVVGVIILSLGLGFVLASLMAYVLSSRLGLFPERRTSEPQSQSNA